PADGEARDHKVLVAVGDVEAGDDDLAVSLDRQRLDLLPAGQAEDGVPAGPEGRIEAPRTGGVLEPCPGTGGREGGEDRCRRHAAGTGSPRSGCRRLP